MSKWDDPDIRERAPHLRRGRNKGVRAAAREARRFDAETRDQETLPKDRRAARRQRQEAVDG